MPARYVTKCPGCGRQLSPHAGHPDSTPWICNNCAHGYWVCELTPDARTRYQPRYHDWGYDPDWQEEIAVKRHQERGRAHNRGTSALPEHIGLLSEGEIQMLKRRKLSPEFRKLLP